MSFVSDQRAPSTYFIAHRGNVAGKGHEKENTIPILDEVAQAGCSLMEIDVRLTHDGHVVCWHDHDITINGALTPIINVSLADIKKYHPEVCTLTEMLEAAAAKKIRLVIEMKTGMAGVRSLWEDSLNQKSKKWVKDLEKKLGKAVGNSVAEHLEKNHQATPPYIITSYQKLSVRAARKQLSNHREGIYFTKMYCDLPKKWQEKWYRNSDGTIGKNRYDGIHLCLSGKLTKANFEKLCTIRDTIGNHALLIVFTVDDLEQIATLQQLSGLYYPNHIITNCAQEAQQQRENLPYPLLLFETTAAHTQ
jgi:glycerophosphoryl diester phosphodiesterase